MRIITAEEAVALIRDGWTVATGGFVGAGHPEALTGMVEQQFIEHGRPRDLTLVYAAGQGDRQTRGAGHFAHAGLVRKVIGGHWGAAPRLGALAVAEQVEAHNWPQGVISQLYRAIAGHKPGVITKIGLNTFVDPRYDGGCLNRRAGKSEIEVLRLLVQGQTKKQIARVLIVSPHTVDHHVRHIYDKIGVSTRAAAALFAVRNQLVGASDQIA